MSLFVFALVLFAALLHAGWNTIVKGSGDKLLTTVLVTASASVLALFVLTIVKAPARASWPFIAASAAFQIGYLVLVARTYRVTDMSLAYPLMRGTAPMLVALASFVGLGDPLSVRAWIGVGIVSTGIVGMAAAGKRQWPPDSIALPFATAVVIALYTLIDGVGVRRSEAPAAYVCWIFVLTGLGLVTWALVARYQALRAYLRCNWRLGLAGGAGTLISYGLALWAMTMAPVAIVAALRETSIPFGTAFSSLLLKERIGARRIVAACLIAAGAAALRLA